MIRLSLSIPTLLAFALVVPAVAAVAPAQPLGCTPVIDTQPQDATGGVGGSISLSVEASGPSLSYLWYFIDPGTGSDIALDELPQSYDGATTPTLTLSDPVTCQTGRYYCQVSNDCGVVYSSQALVRVQPSPPAPSMVAQWGGQGTGPGQFLLPYDIAVDGSSAVYVLDGGTQRVEKFLPNGTFLLQWALGPVGSLGGIDHSTGVAVNSHHEVFVVDYPLHRIRVYDSSGGFLRLFGSLGSGNGQFNRPFRVAFDGADNVYVTDSFNGRVEKFTRLGIYLDQWPDAGRRGIAVDHLGRVYTCGDGVRMYAPDGTLVRSWPTGGDCHDGQLGSQPTALAVNPCNGVFVADHAHFRLQQYDVAGAFVRNWSEVGSSGDEFLYVDGIAVDPAGKVFTADDGLLRVRVFDAGLVLGCGVVGVEDERATAPSRAGLTVSPNPFQGAATIRVELREAALARVAVLDVSGRVVRELYAGPLAQGARRFEWDGREASGARADPGLYFVQVDAGQQRLARTLIRLR